MSSDQSSNENQVGEKVEKVLVSKEECEAALEFWKHYEIPIDPSMKEAFEKFCADPSVQNQNNMKIEVCRAIYSSDHEAFKDDMMSKIVDECKAVYYDAQFDKDLEETLSVPENK